MDDFIRQHMDTVLPEKTQKLLGKPLKDKTGLNKEYEQFLKTLLNKLEKGEIQVHTPASLFNHPVYDHLSERKQEKTDLTAVNLLNIIRQIGNLWKIERKPTFQIQNLVETVWQMKSRYEEEHGDVFII